MSAPTLKPMSVEEYLRTEEGSPVKREYVGGFVYPLHGWTRAQAGATRAHVLITGSIAAALRGAARKQGCLVYSSDMKLRVEASNAFYYPDVMVVCTPQNPDAQTTYETAPCLLVEVTSKSTAQNDRLAKYAAYTALPSLQTYLIVEQTERRVYAYHRQGETWKLQELASSGSIELPCLSYALTLDEVYADVPV
ncbi:Uma2 family endonuclease [Deinococcus hopiensis]|uniref:Endonuclease, Uma2 family (Restriction endonuclease fold) n=1 Tax=Deinococcus hopiensis KR-140 TaxID=695939 RepID=A0A1W1ULT3_9DEIO|nr:Uma2 family endonuclease [Deinococcus hopiensis]SMB82095.1 Endonuclease, Uma2 family (restriction endonuclease fold) [Deinococcus hopiensis KR-140]